jgi:hypothetical protein
LLLNLIDHLPRNSFFVAALAGDDELAKTMPNFGDGDPVQSLAEWSPEKEALAAIFDRLGTLIQATIAAGGGKPPALAPFPRPETAFQRAKEDTAQQRHQDLVRRLLPRNTGT